jgi:hypothetical protein
MNGWAWLIAVGIHEHMAIFVVEVYWGWGNVEASTKEISLGICEGGVGEVNDTLLEYFL